MDWHKHFQTVFFESWQEAGLPNYQDFLPEYYKLIEQPDTKNEIIMKSAIISKGIDHAQLYGVYGFGKFWGNLFGELLGSNSCVVEHTSDWCGRFNLGISLFDYISDEMDGVDRVISLRVFQPFTQAAYSEWLSLTPAEELLSNLAGSVLNDLKIVGIKREGSQKTDSLINVLKQLFNAQNFISREKLAPDADLKKVQKALALKSAEPFRVMGEYSARMIDANEEVLTRKARTIGRAVGYCYWLIDDAKDVWVDHGANQWNLFLLLAAKEDPQILKQNRDAHTEGRFNTIWKNANHAQIMSDQVIKRLVTSIRMAGVSEEVKHHTLGLLSASLFHWYHY